MESEPPRLPQAQTPPGNPPQGQGGLKEELSAHTFKLHGRLRTRRESSPNDTATLVPQPRWHAQRILGGGPVAICCKPLHTLGVSIHAQTMPPDIGDIGLAASAARSFSHHAGHHLLGLLPPQRARVESLAEESPCAFDIAPSTFCWKNTPWQIGSLRPL
jgi:hypothetical protein